MNKLQKGLTALILSGTSLLSANKAKAQEPCYPIFISPPQIIQPFPIFIQPTPIYIEPIHPIYIETIPTPRTPNAKPSLFEKILGNWKFESICNPGGIQRDGSFRTGTFILNKNNDFLQLNSNGTFTQKYNGKISTGFFGAEYNPTQNKQGQIIFYNSLNPRTISEIGKVRLSENHLNISLPNDWFYDFQR